MKIREIHKVVVMGAGGVGKTSIVMQFMEGYFVSNYKPTVEDYYRHTIQLTDGIFHTVEILDTAGTHYFPAMRELNIRSGRGFVLVFSVDSLSSFHETVQLYELIVKIKGTSKVPIVLVGNKSDLKASRQVSLQTILTRKQLEMNNCPYIETSAKFNFNVINLFLQLLQQAKQQTGDTPQHKKNKKILFRRLSTFGSLPNINLIRRKSGNLSSSSGKDKDACKDIIQPDCSSMIALVIKDEPGSDKKNLHLPSLHSPSLHSPSLHSPSLHSPSLHSPSLHSPSLPSPPLNSPLPLHKQVCYSPLMRKKFNDNFVKPQLSLDETKLRLSGKKFVFEHSKISNTNSFDTSSVGSSTSSSNSGSMVSSKELLEQKCLVM